MRQRKRRGIPELNAASMADISFVLLILFLVTTSLDPDKGFSRVLPSLSDSETVKPSQIERRNLMDIKILADGSLLCRGNAADSTQLKEIVKDFIDNPAGCDTLPEKHLTDIPLLGSCMITNKHIISIETHRDAPYEYYFAVHDIIDGAYRELRDNLSVRRFGITYSACNEHQSKAVEQYYPQHISEVYNTSDKEKDYDFQ